MSQVTSQNALVKDSTVQTLNGKLDNLNATLGGNANIAPVFNTATAYSNGDMVNYNGDLYVFTANHSAGAWTGSDAVQTKVSSELSSLKSGLISAVKVCHITVPVDKTDVSGFLGYVLASIISNQEIGTYVVDGVWEGHDYYTGIVYKWASDSSFGFIEYGVYGGGTQNMVLYTACYKTNVYSNYRSVQYQS